MREIYIDLSSDNHWQQPQIFGGYAGEHNETVLKVRLPERMLLLNCSGYRFDFQTATGEKIYLPLISKSEIEEDTVSCILAEQLTVAGKLLFNVSAIKNEVNDVSLIAKTNMVILQIKDSPEGNDVLPDPTGYKDAIIDLVDKRIAEIDPAVVDQIYDPESENAQSGIAVAEAIGAVDNVFIANSTTTYTEIVNAINDGKAVFYLWKESSGQTTFDKHLAYIALYSETQNLVEFAEVGTSLRASNNQPYTIIRVSSDNTRNFYHSALLNANRKINNKTLTSDITLTASDVGALPDDTEIPTVEQIYDPTSENAQSGTAVAGAIIEKLNNYTYENKNFVGVSSVAVQNAKSTAQNIAVQLSTKNLIPIPYDNNFSSAVPSTDEIVTKNGVSFKQHSDGSVTIWGTPTEQVLYYLRNYYHNASDTTRITVPAGNYTLSIKSDTNMSAHGGNAAVRLVLMQGNKMAYKGTPNVFTYDATTTTSAFLQITTAFTATEENAVTVYPQLETGNAETYFTTGIKDFTEVTVTLHEEGKENVVEEADASGEATVTTRGSTAFTISADKILDIVFSCKSAKSKTVESRINQAESASVGYEPLTGYAETLTSGQKITLTDENMCKKNKQLSFFATVNTLGTIVLRHGNQVYNSGYVTIDSTSVKAYSYSTEATERLNVNHALTISGNIGVLCKAGNDNYMTVTIITASGVFTTNKFYWGASHGAIEVESSGSSLSNVRVSWNCDDYKKPLYMYGDSYFDFNNSARWTKWMVEWGFDNCLAEGYPGATSLAVYPDFLDTLTHGTPKYALWCLGMNDADTTTAINASWKTCVENFIAKCLEKGIEPILATIPNCPTARHTFKNAYVKSSGYRYIDFAEAVGATQAGAEWYTGMRADTVHPTELGAKSLAIRALADVPELMQK